MARAAKAGQIPGTAAYAGSVLPDVPVSARVIDYSEAEYRDLEVATSGETVAFANSESVSWIDIDGLHDAQQIQALCERFSIHPLWIEDILNPVSRPKAEVLDNRVFVITRMVHVLPDGTLDTEQVSLVLGDAWVLSFQERPGDVWDGVRRRLESGAGRIRRMNSDYLLHALLDAIVDNYFLVLETLEIQVDAGEDDAVQNPRGGLPVDYLGLKHELAGFRKSVWPMRESLGVLLAAEAACLSSDSLPYYRDIYDHIVQVMDILDATRERLNGVLELHLAMQGQRLNEIMKVLTLVSTIFIPLSFLTGLYGMNFVWMPELRLPWAYPVLLGVMATIGISMGLWFRRRQWL